jgi:exosortase
LHVFGWLVWAAAFFLLLACDGSVGDLMDGVSGLVACSAAYALWKHASQAVWAERTTALFGVGILGLMTVAMGYARLALAGTALGWAICLSIRSTPAQRAVAWPLATLALFPSWPEDVAQAIGFPIRLLTAEIVTMLLRALGLKVVLAGTLVSVPGFAMSIEPACSGLGYFRVLAGAAACLSLFLSDGLSRTLVVASALPAGLIANTIRVTTVGLAGYLLGAHSALHFFHDWSGILFYAAALAVVMGVFVAVSRRVPSRTEGPRWTSAAWLATYGLTVGIGVWGPSAVWMWQTWHLSPRDATGFILFCLAAWRTVAFVAQGGDAPSRSRVGLVSMAMAFAMRAFGLAVDVNVAGPLSGIVFFCGLTWYLGGQTAAQRLLPVWLCLGLAVPGTVHRLDALLGDVFLHVGLPAWKHVSQSVSAGDLLVLVGGMSCMAEALGWRPQRAIVFAMATGATVTACACALAWGHADTVPIGKGLVKPLVVIGWLAGATIVWVMRRGAGVSETRAEYVARTR